MILENLFIHIFPRKSPKSERRAAKDQRKRQATGFWQLAEFIQGNLHTRHVLVWAAAKGSVYHPPGTKKLYRKGRDEGGTGMSSVPGEGKMPYILARSGQWPLPGTSTTWDTAEALVYVRRKVPIMIRQSLRGLAGSTLFWPRSILWVTSWNSLPSTEPREGIRSGKGGKRKLK